MSFSKKKKKEKKSPWEYFSQLIETVKFTTLILTSNNNGIEYKIWTTLLW